MEVCFNAFFKQLNVAVFIRKKLRKENVYTNTNQNGNSFEPIFLLRNTPFHTKSVTILNLIEKIFFLKNLFSSK